MFGSTDHVSSIESILLSFHPFLLFYSTECILFSYIIIMEMSSLALTTGNSLRGASIKTATLGLILLVCLRIPFFFRFNAFILKNPHASFSNPTVESVFYDILAQFVGLPLFFFQVTNLIRAIKPSIVHSTNKTIAFFFTRGTIRETFLLKLSASKKIHTMVNNAFELHLGEEKETDDDSLTCSTQAGALLNYNKVTEQTETVGGLIWCWKSFLNRSLIHKEGVMVNSR